MSSQAPVIEGARPANFGNIYSGKFRDRNFDLKSAGILTYAEGESVDKCIRPTIYSAPLDKLDPTVQKFRDFTHPRLESHRVHYGHAKDPKDYEFITHGVKSDDKSGTAQDCVNPALITNFENMRKKVSESIYNSRKLTPLGQVPIKNLPSSIDRYNQTFGIESNKGESAKDIINPSKPRNIVELEASKKHSMYVFSHEDYDAGEQKTHRYARPFDRNRTFGLITPVYYDGRAAKNSLIWLPTKLQHERTQADSKILDDFREKHTKQLGKTLDPNKDTRFIGPDHVFGLTNTADNFSVGDVIHCRDESNILKGKDKERAYLASLRSHLARFNFVKFTSLAHAFRFYDRNNDGLIDRDELSNACRLSGFAAGDDLLNALLRECDKDRDGTLNFLEFTNFLCYKDAMKLGAELDTKQSDKELKDFNGKTLLKGDELIQKNKVPDGPLVPKTLTNQIDFKAGSWKTTYDIINDAPFRLEPLKKRVYGVASIRNDLVAPEFKKIQDKTNYGNDGNAWSLISPSIFAQHGVYERDVLRPRSKQEISAIFKNIGVDLAPSTFEAVWSQASSKNPYGEVSVEEFRSALDQQHENISKILSDAEAGKSEVQCLGQ